MEPKHWLVFQGQRSFYMFLVSFLTYPARQCPSHNLFPQTWCYPAHSSSSWGNDLPSFSSQILWCQEGFPGFLLLHLWVCLYLHQLSALFLLLGGRGAPAPVFTTLTPAFLGRWACLPSWSHSSVIHLPLIWPYPTTALNKLHSPQGKLKIDPLVKYLYPIFLRIELYSLFEINLCLNSDVLIGLLLFKWKIKYGMGIHPTWTYQMA